MNTSTTPISAEAVRSTIMAYGSKCAKKLRTSCDIRNKKTKLMKEIQEKQDELTKLKGDEEKLAKDIEHDNNMVAILRQSIGAHNPTNNVPNPVTPPRHAPTGKYVPAINPYRKKPTHSSSNFDADEYTAAEQLNKPLTNNQKQEEQDYTLSEDWEHEYDELMSNEALKETPTTTTTTPVQSIKPLPINLPVHQLKEPVHNMLTVPNNNAFASIHPHKSTITATTNKKRAATKTISKKNEINDNKQISPDKKRKYNTRAHGEMVGHLV